MPPLPRAACRCGAGRRRFGEPSVGLFSVREQALAYSPIDILVYELGLAIENQLERVLSRYFVGSVDYWNCACKLSGG